MAGKYDALSIESEMLKFWEKNSIYKKLKDKVKKGKDFYFLDGPPYTSGKLHIGHTWNYSMKDMVLRFKRMQGFNAWDRAGYDTHGLPTAHAVQDKLGIKTKEDIAKYGVAKFVKECRNLCQNNLEAMKKSQLRLGVWMDFDNPYITFKNEFIEGEWWLVKKAHENKRLYEGEKVMHWCSECATAVAKHELEYQNIKDDSIFLKFKLKNSDEYLIIWTTTPWTIPYNLGVMVNPEEDYVKIDVEGETWITAKALAAPLVSGVADKKFEIKEEFKGDALEGTEYEHPLYEELKDIYDNLKKESPKVHTVILSKEYVDTSAGSGLVHMAPGCGPEDYEIGHKNKIPPFNNLQEDGSFPEEMGDFRGMVAKKDDKEFIEYFRKKGALIASTPVEHEYAHCWRCKSPVVFRTTKQWFFRVEDLKEKMRELNKNIYWQPDWAGKRQFDSWLDNLRDNSITRQRYWGCPVPIWRCECGKYEVIGSVKELEKLSKEKAPEDLHKPWIDEVTIRCRCGKDMKRVPDILDVWVDSGTTSWTCLNYPQETDKFEKLWPADFILEGKDQIRGWFNLLFIASMMSIGKPSYKAVYMHGFINDAQGRKMSKSLGNYILPGEVMDKYGADTLRYYSIGGANPGFDLNYNFDDLKIKHRNLMVLWNVHKFLIDMHKEIGKNPGEMDDMLMKDVFDTEERFIFSRLNSTIDHVTKLLHDYKLNDVPLAIEDLFLGLSRTYIQLVRDKSSVGSKEDKEVVLYSIYKVLMECLKLFAPVAPFVSEKIYLNLKQEFGLKQESIHLFDWPKPDKKMIDKKLEEHMKTTEGIIQGILAAREKAQLGVRWPLKSVYIVTTDENAVEAVTGLDQIIKNQTNVKEISIVEELPEIKEAIKANYSKIGPDFGTLAPKIISHIGTNSPETILDHIEKEGKYSFKVDGAPIEITKDHLIIERDVPEHLKEAVFSGGFLYIDTERTDELEAEGYARELMRRVQSQRKKAGLEKTDRIDLFVKVDEEMEESIKPHEEQIKKKCGADKLKISSEKPVRKHEAAGKEKIKGQEFEIMFDKA